ncbi:MAG: helix-turn-helix domain-containing protein [Lachnospiraceae bacterium]|nr:helix-turn-helix domain-containing protein [Lachnospiraceae bacterium]
MKSNLPSNIRTLRKEKGLTQEQLSEVFGVTVGAVHKWEAGLSTPELTLMMEIADFFDVSLDTLTGFDVRDNRIGVLGARIRKLTDKMDTAVLAEAEKALKKYPHNFKIVCESANAYRAFGIIDGTDKKLLDRAIELYEQAIRLAPQNSDPNIDATLLYGQLASIYQIKGDFKKSLELYKAHNAGYIYNTQIGQVLIGMGNYDEAEICLSYAFTGHIGNRINLITAKALCYAKTGRYKDAKDIILMGLNENEYLRRGDGPMYLDRIDCIYLTGLSYIELQTGHKRKAAEYLKQAREKAIRFDSSPDYDTGNERFIDIDDACMAYDTIGRTCVDGITNSIKLLDSDELRVLWESINK